MEVKIDITEIPQSLYDLILEAFIEQFGDGYYTDWKISASKE